MVEHVYYILTGRKVLLPPKDLDDPLFAAKRRAYQEQRKQIEAIAVRFAQHGFNLKNVFKDWIVSDFYRADGLATAAANPQRRAELDDIGLIADARARAGRTEKWRPSLGNRGAS